MPRKTDHDEPRGSAWRQLVLSRCHRDVGELAHLSDDHRAVAQRAHIEDLLEDARHAAHDVPGWRVHEAIRGWWTGGPQDRAWLSLHEAEAEMGELLPPEELAAHGRDLLVKAGRVLAPDDPRVAAVRQIVDRADRWPEGHDPRDGVAIAHLGRAVSAASDERYAQSRSFRNRLIRLSAMAVLMLGLVLLALSTGEVALEDSTEIDLSPLLLGSLVALFGAVGALITAVPPLSRVTGTWNPFSLPAYQMLLKVVLGPTFAIVGLLLLQADMVPGVVTDQMTTTDLLIWSLVFGAGQHMVTRLVDNRVAGLVSSDPEERAVAGDDRRGVPGATPGG